MMIGMPCSGPRTLPCWRSSSIRRASARALGLRRIMALSAGPRWSYAAIRARYASTSPTEVVRPEAMAPWRSVIDASYTSNGRADRVPCASATDGRAPNAAHDTTRTQVVRFITFILVFSEAEVRGQSLQTRQIVRGREHVQVWQCRLHAPGERLVRRTSEQWVEPDDSANPAAQIAQRRPQDGGIARVPAVAQDDERSAPIEESRPPDADRLDALADLRPARPSTLGNRLQRSQCVPIAVTRE